MPDDVHEVSTDEQREHKQDVHPNSSYQLANQAAARSITRKTTTISRTIHTSGKADTSPRTQRQYAPGSIKAA